MILRVLILMGMMAMAAGCAGRRDVVTPEAQPEPPRPGLAETRSIAEEGFVYGLPIVMNYSVMYEYCVDRNSAQFKAPFNQIFSERRVFTYKDTAVVTPNSDTPYSLAWLDLRAEPFVLSVPKLEKNRYYSIMLNDGNTFNYGYIGSRTTGNDAGDYLVVGPEWNGQAPAGIKKVFRSTTMFSLLVYRTQLFNAKDMPNVEKIQSGYRVRPLSAYLRQPAPAPAPVLDFPVISRDLMKDRFFEYLDFALQFAPAGPEEREIRAKLARIGVGPEKTFKFSELSPEHKLEAELGMKAGNNKVNEKVAAIGKNVNGWQVGSSFGDREYYRGDWLLRAAAARAGIYGNNAEEAMYPMTKALASGEALDGGKRDYTLTFKPGRLPPVGTARSRSTSRKNRRAKTRNPTGCRRRTARSIWSCACTGPRPPRPRSCPRERAPGSRPPS